MIWTEQYHSPDFPSSRPGACLSRKVIETSNIRLVDSNGKVRAAFGFHNGMNGQKTEPTLCFIGVNGQSSFNIGMSNGGKPFLYFGDTKPQLVIGDVGDGFEFWLTGDEDTGSSIRMAVTKKQGPSIRFFDRNDKARLHLGHLHEIGPGIVFADPSGKAIKCLTY
jgi:hypothetical protein